MSARGGGGRGWMVVLVAMVLLTVGCLVGYLAAPFEPAPAARAERTGPGVVPAEQRIVAVTDDGALVVLDEGDGTLSETVVPEGMGDVTELEVGGDHEVAYVGRGDDAGSERPSIGLVRLRTGEEERTAEGRVPAVGPVSFPQLDVNVERPELEQMAFVSTQDGIDVVVVENLVTGSRTTIGPRSTGDPPFGPIDDLVWSPSDNRLFGIADGGRVLFWLDADRARSLDEAVVSEPLPDGARWVDATSYGDGLAVVREAGDGRTEILEVGRRRLEPTGRSWSVASSVRLETVDSDPRTSALLATTAGGDLLRFSAAGDDEPVQLSGGIALAAW